MHDPREQLKVIHLLLNPHKFLRSMAGLCAKGSVGLGAGKEERSYKIKS
jgi:hypothetical protein